MGKVRLDFCSSPLFFEPFLLLVVQGMGSRVLLMLGKYSTTELHPWPSECPFKDKKKHHSNCRTLQINRIILKQI